MGVGLRSLERVHASSHGTRKDTPIAKRAPLAESDMFRAASSSGGRTREVELESSDSSCDATKVQRNRSMNRSSWMFATECAVSRRARSRSRTLGKPEGAYLGGVGGGVHGGSASKGVASPPR
jgi:hypothetical protein